MAREVINHTADLEVEYRYYAPEGEVPDPALFVRRTVAGKKCLAIIPLNCAYKYDPRSKREEAEAFEAAFGIATALGLPCEPGVFAQIVIFVADKLSHLFTMPPWEEAKKVIGEYNAVMNGEKISGELTEH